MDVQLLNIIKDFCEPFLETFLIFMTSYFATNTINTAYSLHKDFKPKDFSKVDIPIELKKKYTDIEIEQIGSEKVKEAVLEFADVLKTKFPQDALINFYNNVNEVKIKRKNSIFMFGSSGLYYSKNNKIEYQEFTSIYHELFHMASSVYDSESNIAHVGFRQAYYDQDSNFKFCIGKGINEGYTQLLTLRYFGKKHKVINSYEFEVSIVEKLETIVGQEEMKRLYLNANLLDLIENLKQYASEEDIVNFISAVDFMLNHSSDLFLLSHNKIKTSLTNIYNFLLKAYITKLKQQVETGIITINEFLEQSTEFIKSLGTSVKIGNHNYEYLTKDTLRDNLENVSNISEQYNIKKENPNSYTR